MVPRTAPQRGGRSDGLREGEIAVALPERFDASLYFIGRIHTPWRRRDDCPKNARGSDAVCTIVVDPRWAQGLKGLETASHVIVLYWMDQARRDLVRAGAAPLHRAARHLRVALTGAAQSDRAVSRAARRASTATRSPWSASIASTARRCSTSSRILPRRIRCPTRRSAGTPTASGERPWIGRSRQRTPGVV